MPRHVVAAAWLAGAYGSIAACSFGDLDGLSGGSVVADGSTEAATTSDASPDSTDATAGPSDADSDADADADTAVTDPFADAGPNEVSSGSFENAGSCDGTSYESTLATDAQFHSGSHSCRVCVADTTGGVYSYDLPVDAVGAPAVGTRWYAEAWVRTAVGAPAPPNGVQITLRDADTTPGYQVYDSSPSGYRPITSTWTKISTTLTVTTKTETLDVFVDGEPTDGTCFLVDDLVVRRIE